MTTYLRNLIFLSFFLCVGFQSWANVYVVDTVGDVVAIDGYTSLREAVDSANTNPGSDTIYFNSSLNTDTIKINAGLGQMLITEAVIICGNGIDNTILDGQALNRFFRISDGNETLIKNITFQNGNFIPVQDTMATGGGAIFIDNCSPTFIDCAFNNNMATVTVLLSGGEGGGGGAIFNFGPWGRIASPTFQNCLFEGNISGLRGGAIYNYGLEGVSSPTIKDCQFIENKATHSTYGQGGAIFNNGHDGESSPIIQNCQFIKNEAEERGGAIMNLSRYAGVSSPTISECAFLGNSSSPFRDGGGAIYNDGAGVGTVCKPIFTNCIFLGNFTTTLGGAVFNWGSDGESSSEFNNCTFSGNNSADEVVFTNGGASVQTYKNTIIWGNSSATGGENGFTENFQNSHVQGINSDDPEFVIEPNYQIAPTTVGDLSLQECSKLINLGDNSLIPPGTDTDIEGNERIQIDIVDLGAYESPTGGPYLHCNDLVITLDEGSYTLGTQDSMDIFAGNANCFTDISFSFDKTFFDCKDLDSTPYSGSLSAMSTIGNQQGCNFDIFILEDPDYCCSGGNYSEFNYIESVNIQSYADSFENESFDDGGYGDYKSLVTEVNAGSKYTLTLTAFTVNPITYKYWRIWIDYNSNGKYSSNELVALREGNDLVQVITLTAPTETHGFRNMRISMQLNSSFPDACEDFSIGEVEDYKLFFNVCPDVLVLENQSLDGVYKASQEIITKGNVTVTSETLFRSQEFLLGEEFEVEDGVKFETVKAPCVLMPKIIPENLPPFPAPMPKIFR